MFTSELQAFTNECELHARLIARHLIRKNFTRVFGVERPNLDTGPDESFALGADRRIEEAEN